MKYRDIASPELREAILMSKGGAKEQKLRVLRENLDPKPAPRNPSSAPPKRSWRDNVTNAQDLCDQKFPELKFIVPGLFPEGVTLLVSRPKLGKSWLLLQIGAAVANGVSVLASADHPLQGDVLYLNLEDGDRKAQRRMTKHFGALRQNWPAGMTIARSWRRFDQGGLDDLREWCKSVQKPTLVMIDTLKRVRPPRKAGQTDYDADYEACQGLLQLAHEFPGLAFIVAHHDRKMDAEDVFDTVSGTLGLIGGVDTIAILKRTAQGVSLHIEGRDLVDAVEKAVSFDRETCRWMILGEATEVHRTGERGRVLEALDGVADGLAPSEVAGITGLTSANAKQLLHRMAKAGEIVRHSRGRYYHPDTPLPANFSPPVTTVTTVTLPKSEGGIRGLNGDGDKVTVVTERRLDTPPRAPAAGPEVPDLPAFLDRRFNGLGQPALGPGGEDDDLGHLVGGGLR
jgi:hypothetical protein